MLYGISMALSVGCEYSTWRYLFFAQDPLISQASIAAMYVRVHDFLDFFFWRGESTPILFDNRTRTLNHHRGIKLPSSDADLSISSQLCVDTLDATSQHG